MPGKHSYDDEYKIKMPYDDKNVKSGNTNKKKVKKKKNKALKIFGIIVLIIILLIIGVLAAGYGLISSKLGKMDTVKINEENLDISNNGNISEYRNIAIFGIDSRKDDYGIGNRSDCIMIASLNNKTKEVNLISVYRDTYVQIDGYGLDKITHAYSYGEAELAIKTLNQNLDLNITEFVTVNFDSVAEAVDALGGIKMNITSEELKYINSYIDATSSSTGKKSSHITTAGTHNLDGVQAVAYSRIRYTSGGDYKRTERMRDVIEVMLNKLKTKGIGEINNFIDIMMPKVYTNITTGDVISLIPSAMNIKMKDSIGWPYKTKGITLDKWYGVPVTLESNVIKLHKEEFDDNDYELPKSIKTISDKIITKTGYSK